jgi:hypothetical protein
VQQAVHQRPIKRKQQALADDIGVIGEHGRTGRFREEVQQVEHRPREMVVDDVRLFRELTKEPEDVQRNVGRSDAGQPRRKTNRVTVDGDGGGAARRTRCQHRGSNPSRLQTSDELPDHARNAGDVLRKVDLENVQDSQRHVKGLTPPVLKRDGLARLTHDEADRGCGIFPQL